MENPFGAGRSLSTDVSEQISADWEQFQSLWNRAGLSTHRKNKAHLQPIVSIPLEQGGVFRQNGAI